jgi:sugar lactone lactonase YvrE
MECGRHVGAVALRENGGLVLALRDGFGLTEPGGGEVRLVAPCEDDVPGNRFNDGKVDSAGRFWAGTMTYAEVPGDGALYRLDPDLRITTAVTGIGVSNGLDWSGDDRVLYYVDSLTPHVDAFDFDAGSGTVANRRPLVTIPDGDGAPDGLAVDAEGYLWVALWGGSQVRRFAPDGTLAGVIDVPAALVTSVAFGGSDLRDLYITSARIGLDGAALAGTPSAGSIFRARPGVQGVTPNRFAG